jgi:hypothetical protein
LEVDIISMTFLEHPYVYYPVSQFALICPPFFWRGPSNIKHQTHNSTHSHHAPLTTHPTNSNQQPTIKHQTMTKRDNHQLQRSSAQ